MRAGGALVGVLCPTPNASLSFSPPAALSSPPQINSEPYGSGWMMKIEVSDKGQVADLMDADAYQKHCEH